MMGWAIQVQYAFFICTHALTKLRNNEKTVGNFAEKATLCHVQNRSKSFKRPSHPAIRLNVQVEWPGRRFLVPHSSSKEMWLSLFFHGICSKFYLILCRCSITDLLEAVFDPKLANWTLNNTEHHQKKYIVIVTSTLSCKSSIYCPMSISIALAKVKLASGSNGNPQIKRNP